MEKTGFTLAEVLITLAIIGVVAALTIPTVIRSYQKKQYAVAMKKAYSNLSRVHNQILLENGGYDPIYDLSGYDGVTIQKYCNENWVPKLKVIKKCKDAIDCGYPSNTPFKQLNKWRTPTSYQTILNDSGRCSYALADGSLLIINSYDASSGGSVVYSIDTNGAKAPNILGVDLFDFVLHSKRDPTIKPRAYNLSCPIGNYCDPAGSAIDGGGAFCAARILKCDGGEIKYDW